MSQTFDPVRQAAALALAAGQLAMVVEVTRAQGSVPREVGSRMLVTTHTVIGTIGGGHLELQAIAHSRAMLAGAVASHQQHYALGPSLGQCCGGALDLRTQALSAATLAAWPEAQPLFRLQLYGAGHVGRAIAQLLERIPCQVQWIDEREAEFPTEPSAPHLQRICAEAGQAEVASASPGGYFLVLTHSHDLDLAITHAILQRGDFAYLGLIGSATKRARFVHRLAARGIAPELLARITCPIGLPGIDGKAPAVIAVAVVAQLLMAAGG